jgi:hypothetical protein
MLWTGFIWLWSHCWTHANSVVKFWVSYNRDIIDQLIHYQLIKKDCSIEFVELIVRFSTEFKIV